MLVISPWAKDNFVDHTVTDQSSIIHFIEDNWLGGQRIGNGSFDAHCQLHRAGFRLREDYEPMERYA